MSDDPSHRGYRRAARNGRVAVATSSTLLLPMSLERCGVVISPTSLNRCSIGIGQAAVLDTGYTVYPGEQPLALTRDLIGDAIQQDIFAIFETTGETLAFLEILEG